MIDLRDRSYWKSQKKKKSTCWDGCVRWGRSTKGYVYEEVTFDYTFEIVGIGDTPEGTYTHCAFCGVRIKHLVYLKRLPDKTFWKVGHSCVNRVGLYVTESTKRLHFRREPKPPRPKVEEPKVEKPKEMHPGTKKFLEELKKKEDEEFRKEIERLVKGEKKPKVEEVKRGEVKKEVTPQDIQDLFDDID